MATEDQLNHFLVMLGSCAEGARLAHATLTVELDDGTQVEGVPFGPPEEDFAKQVDHTGTARVLLLGGTQVETARVRSYRVSRPR